MLDDVSRRAGPYQGGTRYFSFDFKVFQETDVAVMVSSDGAAGETALVYGTDYSVELNADQDATPGGLVVLTSALESTKVLAIVSAIPYTQPTQLTNYSRFPPEILNKSLDRLEAQIQQLKEELSRAVMVDATDTMTPKELKQKLLEVATRAEDFARRAEKIYTETTAMSKHIDGVWDDMQLLRTEVRTAHEEISRMTSKSEEIAERCTSILERITDIGETVDAIFPYLNDLTEIRRHLDEVHKVGQDLISTESGTLDLGSVLDPPDTISTVQGGYVKKVAEHIDDCIHPVAEHLDEIATAPANAEAAEQAKRVATKAAEDAAAAASQSEEILNRLIENEGFDFERTFEEALAGGTSASSGSSLVATFEQALRA